ncbi:BspA family leucine-rich repeat surface protein [Dysgonomonas capnocytophagoides]|uniref:BspA family leucine-rich repeat surface protein n=1 Tax=Dysgonomonas capnocytophagoides TaxID=45254 RepID=UPI00292535E6|nr:hypothetical protein DCPSUM001_34030 [Dysgonomonas capnocytophagoides]
MVLTPKRIFIFLILSLVFLGCKDENTPIEEPVEIPYLEKMYLTVATKDNEFSVKLPLSGTINCEVDWNDGTTETVSEAYPTHTYTKAGKYLITIAGTVTSINSSELNASELPCITGVYNWGKTGLTNMYSAFKGCTELTYVSNDNGQGSFADVKDFRDAFQGCLNLTEVPSGLFDNCTQITSFNNIFYGCSELTKIPSGLFDSCTDVTDFQAAFKNCNNLTEIPSGLFDSCTRVVSFKEVFYGCSELTKIPSGLFDNCTNVMDLQAAFKNCKNLVEIPEKLFDKCIYAEDFSMAFQNCENLIEIPFGLFDNSKQIKSLIQTFAGCVNLEGESPYTVIDESKIHLYERNDGIGGFTEPQYIYFCFSECVKLSDYANIPNSWK